MIAMPSVGEYLEGRRLCERNPRPGVAESSRGGHSHVNTLALREDVRPSFISYLLRMKMSWSMNQATLPGFQERET